MAIKQNVETESQNFKFLDKPICSNLLYLTISSPFSVPIIKGRQNKNKCQELTPGKLKSNRELIDIEICLPKIFQNA